MKSTFAVALALLFTLAASAQQRRVIVGGAPDLEGWPQPEVRPGLSDSEIAASIAKFAQTLYDDGRFSGVVLVAKDGRTLLEKAWGLADRDAKIPNGLDTRFNIGSINKIFTKVAIAQLAAAGALSLDDTVRKHLPDYPSAVADRITIRQLVDHRSGLGDIFGMKYFEAPPSSLRELQDFLPLFVDQPLRFEPGTSQAYSNAGYVVLGLIIERVSGMKYRDYVEQKIFRPAGMHETGFEVQDGKVEGRATGYTRRGPSGPLPELRDNHASLPGRPSSAGGAFVSAPDLLRFFNALEAGKLLPPKWTNWVETGSLEPSNRRPALALGGGAFGLNAAVSIVDGWSVIALANLDPPAAEAMGRAAREIIHGKLDEADAERSGAVVRKPSPSAPEK